MGTIISGYQISDLIVLSGREWKILRLKIHCPNTADGYPDLFLDDLDAPIASAMGRNMHDGFQHYLKLGTYRHPDIRATAKSILMM